jgi:2,3-bisphosphoglycerate-independent phosphoglycerate mutase
MDLDIISSLARSNETKLLLLVMDGLGGMPGKRGEPTELEAAHTPHLDELAAGGICGLHEPVGTGITPGSGPSHLGLFGYDPLKYEVGRGVLSALGIDFPLQKGDVAARGNFCSIDENGAVTDRRAGRIGTEKNRELCERLRQIRLPGVELFVETVKEHRFLLVLRGEGLVADIGDTDPQKAGTNPLEPKPQTRAAGATAELVQDFVRQAGEKLADQQPANMVLLRGFASMPQWPTMNRTCRFRPAAIAAYPMYRGLARLLGMEVLEGVRSMEDEFHILAEQWDNYDFFYLHVKGTDSAGEDGDFRRKVSVIEQVDSQLPRLRYLSPDVVAVTGDHATPSRLHAHSWHPVPLLLWSKEGEADGVRQFGESHCREGVLGSRLPSTSILPLMLAHSRRLAKFGA